MKEIQRLLKGIINPLAIIVSVLAALASSTVAQAQSETSCTDPIGQIEDLTLRILDGASDADVKDAFSRLDGLSESGAQSALDAYVEVISERNDPATVSMLVSDNSTCVRLVVI